jgi:hypothetical protein
MQLPYTQQLPPGHFSHRNSSAKCSHKNLYLFIKAWFIITKTGNNLDLISEQLQKLVDH